MRVLALLGTCTLALRASSVFGELGADLVLEILVELSAAPALSRNPAERLLLDRRFLAFPGVSSGLSSCSLLLLLVIPQRKELNDDDERRFRLRRNRILGCWSRAELCVCFRLLVLELLPTL